MHIELTDHLRCPKDHEEAFLILLPDQMNGRRVMAGVLACPICDWRIGWENGIPDFGEAWESSGTAPLPAEAVQPMLGIEGRGGWIALAGSAGLLAAELIAMMPGVGIVSVNPPGSVEASESVQVIRGAIWPLKTQALRGAVLGNDAIQWRDQALASLLPGRHLIGTGEPPDGSRDELLGSTGDVWVVRGR